MTKRNVVHVEIPAANLEGTGKFYSDLFGWKIRNYSAVQRDKSRNVRTIFKSSM